MADDWINENCSLDVEQNYFLPSLHLKVYCCSLGPFHIITIATLLESREVALKAEMLQKQFEIAYDI